MKSAIKISDACSLSSVLCFLSSVICCLFSVFCLLSYAVPADAATYYFGGAKKQLSTATSEVAAGYYDTTDLTAVATQLAAGNIKNTVNIFGIVGTYEGAGGTNYGIPKTGQQPGLPSGTPFRTGDDCSYASPEASDVGYPRGKGNWANYNATRFTTAEPVPGEVVVTDNATGLMWVSNGNSAGCNNGGTKIWTDAIDFAEGLTFAGHSDWRLPNINELVTIVNRGTYNPAIYTTYFSNTQFSNYWSSTTYAVNTDSVWVVYFGNGYLNLFGKSSGVYVRPVRGGQ